MPITVSMDFWYQKNREEGWVSFMVCMGESSEQERIYNNHARHLYALIIVNLFSTYQDPLCKRSSRPRSLN